MARLLTTPPLTLETAELLAAAGPYRVAVTAAVWPQVTTVLDEVAAAPGYLRRVPAPWVGPVLACLTPSVAHQAVLADGRAHTRQVYRALQTREAYWPSPDQPPRPTPDVHATALTERLRHLVDMPVMDPSCVQTLAEDFQVCAPELLDGDVRLAPDVADALGAAAAAMWRRRDWTDVASRRALAATLPSALLGHLLATTPVWTQVERELFALVWPDTLWELVAAGPPKLDIDDVEQLRAEIAASSARHDPFIGVLLEAALGVARDFGELSRSYWAEHTGAVLLWVSKAGPQARQRALDDHRELATTPDELLEVSAHPERMRALFVAMGTDSELRLALAQHLDARTVPLWVELATPQELDVWIASRAPASPLVLDEVLDLLDDDAVPFAVVEKIVAATPGLLDEGLWSVSPQAAAWAVRGLGAACGDDPIRWRTALYLVDDDYTVAEVAAAVCAIHGPVPAH